MFLLKVMASWFGIGALCHAKLSGFITWLNVRDALRRLNDREDGTETVPPSAAEDRGSYNDARL